MSNNNQTLEKQTNTVMRPVTELVPLIKEEIQLGDEAGLEHYIKAGSMLLEAKAQMRHGKFTSWSTRTFKRSKVTLASWMRASKSTARDTFDTLSEAAGDTRPSHHRPTWHEPVKRIFKKIDLEAGERFVQHFQNKTKESKLVHALANQIIDAGYKLLATKLHPDKGGSVEGMQRLNEARKLLRRAV